MNRVFRCFLWLIVATVSLHAQGWNVGPGGNSARNGLSAESGPIEPTIAWDAGLAGTVAQQAVSDDGVVFMARIHDLNDVLNGTLIVAHDIVSGDTLWTAELPVDFPSTDWRSRVSAAKDGRVYVTRAGNSNLSYLYALSADSGEILWQSEALVDEGSTEGAAFASNGDLVVGSFNSIVRINSEDGSTEWSTIRSCPTSSGCQVAIYDSSAYIWQASVDGPMISRVDISTGDILYSAPGIGGGFIQQLGPFVGPDGTVYAPRTQNNVNSDSLVAYIDTGDDFRVRWSIPLGYVPFGTFAVGPDGSVYSYTAAGEVVRIDPITGSGIDTSVVVLTDFPAQPRIAVDADGILYLTNGGFGTGALYSLDPDLNVRWMESITNVNVGGPTLGKYGTLVVCGIGTDVRAYRTQSVGIAAENDPVPALFELRQNYPNPFNPSTVVGFDLGRSGTVSLEIYNVAGQLIRELVNESAGAGHHDYIWDGTSNNGLRVASGVYFYRLTYIPGNAHHGMETVAEVITRKMLLVR